MLSSLLFLLFSTQVSHPSTCQISPSKFFMSCAHKRVKIDVRGVYREVLIAVPANPPPKSGHPVVFFFQGSLFPITFSRSTNQNLGLFNEMITIKNLLDHGYVVVAPRALGGIAWQTNLKGVSYQRSSDRHFIDELLNRIRNQNFGSTDASNLFAVGISSGGYMTDRMAWSHKNFKFKALAIASASHATCGGPLCSPPKNISSMHPPTLFMHGEDDPVVPLRTMTEYEEILMRSGVPTRVVVEKKTRHRWLNSAPDDVVSWFELFRTL